MQNYIDLAEKNGLILFDNGPCQLCDAKTKGGIHECVELFSLGFSLLDFSKNENHFYRFLSVDAHTLQHSEIHGRWNNHFHLSRLHLIFKYKINWEYSYSPLLSDFLNDYKKKNDSEVLIPPKQKERGSITTIDVLNKSQTEKDCQKMIESWAKEVYNVWVNYHHVVDDIAKNFLEKRPNLKHY